MAFDGGSSLTKTALEAEHQRLLRSAREAGQLAVRQRKSDDELADIAAEWAELHGEEAGAAFTAAALAESDR